MAMTQELQQSQRLLLPNWELDESLEQRRPGLCGVMSLPWTTVVATPIALGLRHGSLVSLARTSQQSGNRSSTAACCTATLFISGGNEIDGSIRGLADAKPRTAMISPAVSASFACSGSAEPLSLTLISESSVVDAPWVTVQLVDVSSSDIRTALSAPDIRVLLDHITPLASVSARDAFPPLACLLDGAILHDGQCVSVSWFSSRSTQRVMLRVWSTCTQDARASQPFRIRAGVTTVNVAPLSMKRFTAGAGNSPRCMSVLSVPRTVSSDLTMSCPLPIAPDQWIATASKLAPGLDASVRSLVVLASSLFAQCSTMCCDPGCAADVRAHGQVSTSAILCDSGPSAASAFRVAGPSGVLLCGPHGSGKSSLVAAVAEAGNVRLVRVSPSQLYSPTVGASEAALDELALRLLQRTHCAGACRLRSLLALSLRRFVPNGDTREFNDPPLQRRCPFVTSHQQPSIVLLEDVDVLLPMPRTESRNAPSAYASRIAAALLTCMRKTRAAGAPILWVGSTSTPMAVSAAATAPGAMDAVVRLHLPSAEARTKMLARATRSLHVQSNVTHIDGAALQVAQVAVSDFRAAQAEVTAGNGVAAPKRESMLGVIARRARGYTAADLVEVVREAATRSFTRSTTVISRPCVLWTDFYEAMESVPPSALAEAIGSPPRSALSMRDFVGYDDAVKRAIAAVLTPLQRTAVYERLGVPPPRGLLIHGPSGSGKTLLAHSLAAEAMRSGLARSLVVSSTEIAGCVVGSSEAALAAVFSRARELAPCILVLDNFEVLAEARQGIAAGKRTTARSPRSALHRDADRTSTGGAFLECRAANDRAPRAPRRQFCSATPQVRRKALTAPIVTQQTCNDMDDAAMEDGACKSAGSDSDAEPPATSGQPGDRLLSHLLTEMDGLYTGAAGGEADSSLEAHTVPLPDAQVPSAAVHSDLESRTAVLARPLLVVPAVEASILGTPRGAKAHPVSTQPVIVIAVTRFRDSLDPAVLRPGRLDTHVQLRSPDDATRLALLRHYFTRSPLADDLKSDTSVLSWVASVTDGWSAAALEGLWYSAATVALRRQLGDGTAGVTAAVMASDIREAMTAMLNSSAAV